jgi:signal transduction histidine kinase
VSRGSRNPTRTRWPSWRNGSGWQGVPVGLDIEGTLAGLPAGVSLGVYRIVQESLTNTLKHAGPGARVDVRSHGCRIW